MSPNAGGGGEWRSLSQWVQLYTGAQINFGDLTPYLTYGQDVWDRVSKCFVRDPTSLVVGSFGEDPMFRKTYNVTCISLVLYPERWKITTEWHPILVLDIYIFLQLNICFWSNRKLRSPSTSTVASRAWETSTRNKTRKFILTYHFIVKFFLHSYTTFTVLTSAYPLCHTDTYVFSA